MIFFFFSVEFSFTGFISDCRFCHKLVVVLRLAAVSWYNALKGALRQVLRATAI